jgi:hypothetical protein
VVGIFIWAAHTGQSKTTAIIWLMLATNHGTTGMILGALLPLPIAIPVAFASHFVMDALPHYGIDNKKRDSNKMYKQIVYIDTTLALSFAVLTAVTGRWSMFIVGWVAYSPDGYWVYMYLKSRTFNLKPKNKIARFHQKIQLERPWGLYIEIPLACLLIFIAFRLR